ncbi:GNAT family N-acetyltransferase [Sediminibacter sp. Hel_I_10]|uniref:GNAT family N-acetyltransferase n=1 Tax=Sediminibacter sp. Hel_I_10 TaxID=1392490 RepID=UPI00047A29FA|nr:GNAT family N-acetyltransferase [Sediminibacter sp. Hel_I_10]
MDIKQDEASSKGRFYYEKDGETKAVMTYSRAGEDKIIIDHTEVDPSLQGEGIGYQLVDAAVEYARDHQIKIMPLCTFASAVFKKKPEYNDVKF